MNELLLMCMIAGRRAAIPAIRVQSVIEIDEITPIPGAPSFIRGLTALRSQALTVIDCTVALGLEPGETPAQQRAAVVDIEGGHNLNVARAPTANLGMHEADIRFYVPSPIVFQSLHQRTRAIANPGNGHPYFFHTKLS